MGFGYGFIAGFKGLGVDKRAQDGRAQEPLAHWSLALVECVEERCARVLSCKQGFNEFEIANRDLIEFESRRVLLEFQTVNVQRFNLLRGANVVEHCAGCYGSSRMAVEAVAFERADVQLALNQRHGEFAGPDPVFDAGPCSDTLEAAVKL